MTRQAASIVTADLQLTSLELDIETLQSNMDEDRKEFQEFHAMVNKNFVTMQGNFDKIQENFRRLLLDPNSKEGQIEQSQKGSAQVKINELHSPTVPPGRPKQLNNYTPPSVHGQEKEAQVVVGSAVLRDHTGKELNLDVLTRSHTSILTSATTSTRISSKSSPPPPWRSRLDLPHTDLEAPTPYALALKDLPIPVPLPTTTRRASPVVPLRWPFPYITMAAGL
ncbi:hypothetical protein D1007_49821 [Hordeum vulgare]|nr:hypothetical protein D1007_49821 [Hordeum vulgare]